MLGGGPSLPALLKGKKFKCPVIAINDAFRLYPEADMLFFGDTKWYWWNREDIKTFKGLKVTCDRRRVPSKVDDGKEIYPPVNGVPDINIVRHGNNWGVCSEDNRKIFFNSSSGGAAIGLAWRLGATKVVLVGYDMRLVKGERNWRRHPNQSSGPQKGYENFLRPFDAIAADAKRLKLEIVNATPGSGLDHFPFIGLDSLCKLWTSIKLFAISLLIEQVLPDMVMGSLSFV